MKRRSIYLGSGFVLSLFLVAGCAQVRPGSFTDSKGQIIHRELIPHSKSKDKKVELFWTKPEGLGPWPAVIFIHGHQIENRIGGEEYVNGGTLRRVARMRGYVAASVSQPGYGNSDGPPDYCGPFTQDAVLTAIEFLRKKGFIKADRVGLYGGSRGAVVASMVATKDAQLAAVVLVAGFYDLGKYYGGSGGSGDPRIRDRNIEMEAGTSAEAFRARSAIYHADKVKGAVLLLHGAYDEPETAEALAQKLRANGVPVRIKIFETGHHIPGSMQATEIRRFWKTYLD